MRTCATICTGGGLADVGLLQAGLRPVWGVEIEPRRAAHAHRALAVLGVDGWTCYGDLLGLDPQTLPGVDVIHASLPCTSYSRANPKAAQREGGRTSSADLALAQAVIDLLSHWRHRATRLVTFEQVSGWQGSAPHALVVGALHRLGYQTIEGVLNAADFGVPQVRRRLWLVARRGGPVPVLPHPTHAEPTGTLDLLRPAWRGWETACEGWREWPVRPLTPRMAAVLRHAGVPLFVDSVTKNWREKVVCLIDSRQHGEACEDGERWRLPIFRQAGQPAPAQTARSSPQILTSEGARSLPSRAYARLFGLPEAWPCPPTPTEAHEVCGLGVAPVVLEQIVRANEVEP